MAHQTVSKNIQVTPSILYVRKLPWSQKTASVKNSLASGPAHFHNKRTKYFRILIMSGGFWIVIWRNYDTCISSMGFPFGLSGFEQFFSACTARPLDRQRELYYSMNISYVESTPIVPCDIEEGPQRIGFPYLSCRVNVTHTQSWTIR